MSRSVNTGSLLVSRSGSPTSAVVSLYSNSWNDDDGEFAAVTLLHEWGIVAVQDNQGNDGTQYSSSGNWTGVVSSLPADTTYKFRAGGFFSDSSSGYTWGTTKSKRTGAVLATTNTPSGSSVTATTATVSCGFYPNVVESTWTAQLYYKKSSDSSWTAAGTPDTGTNSYALETATANLTGLTPSTQYQVFMHLVRDTSVSADNSIASTTGTFITLAAAPDITTIAASSIGYSGATLNGSVDPNGISCRVRFHWGLNSNPVNENTTDWQSFSGDGAQSFSATISGLSSSTTHYFVAEVQWPSPTYGNSTIDT